MNSFSKYQPTLAPPPPKQQRVPPKPKPNTNNSNSSISKAHPNVAPPSSSIIDPTSPNIAASNNDATFVTSRELLLRLAQRNRGSYGLSPIHSASSVPSSLHFQPQQQQQEHQNQQQQQQQQNKHSHPRETEIYMMASRRSESVEVAPTNIDTTTSNNNYNTELRDLASSPRGGASPMLLPSKKEYEEFVVDASGIGIGVGAGGGGGGGIGGSAMPDFENQVDRLRARLEASRKLQELNSQMDDVIKDMERSWDDATMSAVQDITMQEGGAVGLATNIIGPLAVSHVDFAKIVRRNKQSIEDIFKEYEDVSNNRKEILADVQSWFSYVKDRESNDSFLEEVGQLGEQEKAIMRSTARSIEQLFSVLESSSERLLKMQVTFKQVHEVIDRVNRTDFTDNTTEALKADLAGLDSDFARLSTELKDTTVKLRETESRCQLLERMLEKKNKIIETMRKREEMENNKMKKVVKETLDLNRKAEEEFKAQLAAAAGELALAQRNIIRERSEKYIYDERSATEKEKNKHLMEQLAQKDKEIQSLRAQIEQAEEARRRDSEGAEAAAASHAETQAHVQEEKNRLEAALKEKEAQQHELEQTNAALSAALTTLKKEVENINRKAAEDEKRLNSEIAEAKSLAAKAENELQYANIRIADLQQQVTNQAAIIAAGGGANNKGDEKDRINAKKLIEKITAMFDEDRTKIQEIKSRVEKDMDAATAQGLSSLSNIKQRRAHLTASSSSETDAATTTNTTTHQIMEYFDQIEKQAQALVKQLKEFLNLFSNQVRQRGEQLKKDLWAFLKQALDPKKMGGAVQDVDFTADGGLGNLPDEKLIQEFEQYDKTDRAHQVKFAASVEELEDHLSRLSTASSNNKRELERILSDMRSSSKPQDKKIIDALNIHSQNAVLEKTIMSIKKVADTLKEDRVQEQIYQQKKSARMKHLVFNRAKVDLDEEEERISKLFALVEAYIREMTASYGITATFDNYSAMASCWSLKDFISECTTRVTALYSAMKNYIDSVQSQKGSSTAQLQEQYDQLKTQYEEAKTVIQSLSEQAKQVVQTETQLRAQKTVVTFKKFAEKKKLINLQESRLALQARYSIPPRVMKALERMEENQKKRVAAWEKKRAQIIEERQRNFEMAFLCLHNYSKQIENSSSSSSSSSSIIGQPPPQQQQQAPKTHVVNLHLYGSPLPSPLMLSPSPPPLPPPLLSTAGQAPSLVIGGASLNINSSSSSRSISGGGGGGIGIGIGSSPTIITSTFLHRVHNNRLPSIHKITRTGKQYKGLAHRLLPLGASLDESHQRLVDESRNSNHVYSNNNNNNTATAAATATTSYERGRGGGGGGRGAGGKLNYWDYADSMEAHKQYIQQQWRRLHRRPRRTTYNNDINNNNETSNVVTEEEEEEDVEEEEEEEVADDGNAHSEFFGEVTTSNNATRNTSIVRSESAPPVIETIPMASMMARFPRIGR